MFPCVQALLGDFRREDDRHSQGTRREYPGHDAPDRRMWADCDNAVGASHQRFAQDVEVAHQVTNGLVAFVAVLLQRLAHDALQFGRCTCFNRLQRGGLALQYPRQARQW